MNKTKVKKPTKSDRQRLEDDTRGKAIVRNMVRTTLLMAIRDLTFDQLVEAWWQAQADV